MAKREIHVLMPNGEEVFLGRLEMSDKDVQLFLDGMASIYSNRAEPIFNVGPAVFDAKKFAGVFVKG